MSRPPNPTKIIFQRSYTDRGRQRMLLVTKTGVYFEAFIDDLPIGRCRCKTLMLQDDALNIEHECMMFNKHCVLLTEEEVLEVNCAQMPIE